MTYTMMQACRELGMTYQTLKFYCNQGLVPNVKRDKNNRRVFDERDVEWLRGLGCPARKAFLAEKREKLVERLAEVQASIDYIDWKQGFYDDVLAGRTEYYSNLLPKDGE